MISSFRCNSLRSIGAPVERWSNKEPKCWGNRRQQGKWPTFLSKNCCFIHVWRAGARKALVHGQTVSQMHNIQYCQHITLHFRRRSHRLFNDYYQGPQLMLILTSSFCVFIDWIIAAMKRELITWQSRRKPSWPVSFPVALCRSDGEEKRTQNSNVERYIKNSLWPIFPNVSLDEPPVCVSASSWALYSLI